MIENGTTQVGAPKEKSLVGCIVKLDSEMGGMLRDDHNKFVFSYFEGGRCQMQINSDTNLTTLIPNIKHGILRVFKNGKDVSEEHGGPPKIDRFIPIVKEGLKEPDAEDKNDQALLRVLESYDPEEIRSHVATINDYNTLDRLLQLEKAGDNLASQPRPDVVDIIFQRTKEVSGMTEPEEEKGSEEELKIR